jgi:hypothetical protein
MGSEFSEIIAVESPYTSISLKKSILSLLVLRIFEEKITDDLYL